MSYEELEPREAHARLSSEEGALYVDVRSVPEFEESHPEGALNLPLFHLGPGGMQPNPEFLDVAEAVLPKDRLLVVGCKSGGRSARVCMLLAQRGFTKLVNVAGGLHGSHHPATGQLLVLGWEACELPVSQAPAEGATWEELRSRQG